MGLYALLWLEEGLLGLTAVSLFATVLLTRFGMHKQLVTWSTDQV